jgi:hypothetical protein
MAAGLLVLLGLGLFVGGILTGTTAFYWGCVGACAVAAVLLFLARRQAPAGSEGSDAPAATTAEGAAATPPAAQEPVEATARRQAAEEAPGDRAEETPAAAEEPEQGEPPVEEVEVTDLLLVVDLTDEVLVVDEHPRYHLEGCRHLTGREPVPIPLDEARTDGFTPCGVCTPDRHLADRARARK